jgi:menaquinol-cytochrome c reductase iron-sulfur subunit
MGKYMENETETQYSGDDKTGRRTFLKWLIGAVAALNGLVIGLPFVKTVIGGKKKKEETKWAKVVEINSIPKGKPTDVRFEYPESDAYIHREVIHSVWVIKHSDSDLTVFSPICPHLGCHYTWNKNTHHFECPCHASVFSINGKVLGGPAPRPLDTLPKKIENGTLYVDWVRYQTGTPEKIPV